MLYFDGTYQANQLKYLFNIINLSIILWQSPKHNSYTNCIQFKLYDATPSMYCQTHLWCFFPINIQTILMLTLTTINQIEMGRVATQAKSNDGDYFVATVYSHINWKIVYCHRSINWIRVNLLSEVWSETWLLGWKGEAKKFFSSSQLSIFVCFVVLKPIQSCWIKVISLEKFILWRIEILLPSEWIKQENNKSDRVHFNFNNKWIISDIPRHLCLDLNSGNSNGYFSQSFIPYIHSRCVCVSIDRNQSRSSTSVILFFSPCFY